MSKTSMAGLPTVLIVENENGDIYIVENQESKPQVERILKSEENSRKLKRKTKVKFESIEQSPNIHDKKHPNNILFIESSKQFSETQFKDKASLDNIVKEDLGTFETKNEPNTKAKKQFWKHKARSLSGKIACKYCNSFFSSRQEKALHACKYLECDSKNFICRVCNKELSKNTFSNHLHETVDCQYCGKKFINPRNMKSHIKNQHKKFVQPIRALQEPKEHPAISLGSQPVKAKYQRKKEKLECDYCGKYLVCRRSLSYHMNLHTGQTSYICENCGEKFYTPNGIRGHSCEKKRKRPVKDFRTYDLRYCRFCDSRFESFDENKAHSCEYQHNEDKKSVICRYCGKVLTKLGFNRHIEIHSGIEWICSVCSKQLATERALKLHLTTHSLLKPYKCKFCSESFINKVVLDHHYRFHGASTKVFRCEHCFKILSHETSLKNHIQRVHKNTVQCELCKREFASREVLKDHMKSEHAPCVCDTCNKSFSLPRYLKMHQKLHFNDMVRVQCSVCSKLLGMKTIKAHVFRHHKDYFEEWKLANPTL